ncbi:Choline dehydrogenase, mitochondrial [Hondaea fermentalgiana]|uniref:Choline dehydrogenase, mitochondrial n=1 Tax=Hondaea fermentalgiana TaxID=2315210 RepID=A0A2R5G6E2_9STRA|nr:Choline dehydrogenase, mitochondrial [Hondaea fermentalgiana]|eukprot:GBG25358.1 Choline dehydrogenase, mitochondrial [Hondaea fermentalgiana]
MHRWARRALAATGAGGVAVAAGYLAFTEEDSTEAPEAAKPEAPRAKLARFANSLSRAKARSESASEKTETASSDGDWDAVVDVLVVGAGSSGCALASRLAQSAPDKRTLLVEAGDSDDLPEIQTAVAYFDKAERIFGSSRDHQYHAEAQDELLGRALYWPRGKVVGGCSSFNTMVYLRADKADYDAWAEKLGPGFEDFSAVGTLPFFRRAESHPGDPAVHGKDGPMHVAPLTDDVHFPDGAAHEVTKAFIRAANILGVPTNYDFANGTLGVNVNDVNARNGRRCNAAAFLKMVGAYPERGTLSVISRKPYEALNVWLCASVQKIIVDPKSKRALGVELRLGPSFDDEDNADDDEETETKIQERSLGKDEIVKGRTVRIRVRDETILSCGAVDSPRILMLSGVGPKQELENVGVPCIVDVPGVGKQLQDHLHVPMCYRIPQGVKPHSHSNICEGSLFTKLNASSKSPDLQVHVGTIFFAPDGFEPLGEGFTLTPSLIHPESVGSIRLASADPEDQPIIDARYLSDPEGRDMAQLVAGVRFVRQLGREMLKDLQKQAPKSCAEKSGTEVFPGPEVESDAEIEAYIRRYVGTMYHPVGTCRVGRDDDPLAVLDSHFRVRGAQGLRVVDASAIPKVVGANTNATCIMLGEMAADKIALDLAKRHKLRPEI